MCGVCDRDRSGNPGISGGKICSHFFSGGMRNCNGEPGFLDFLGWEFGMAKKSKKIAQKGIFVILRNAVFLEDEKKGTFDLYRRNDRHGKRL